jgi:hypothetical protein
MKIARILSIIGFSLVMAMLFSVGFDVSAGIQVHPAAIALPLAGVGIASYLGYIPLPVNSLMLNFGAIANMSFPEIDGREAMGGYTSIAWLYFTADISQWPIEPNIETATNIDQLAKLSGNYIMKDQKFMFEVKVPPNSTKFSPASQGEMGGKSFKLTGEIYVPGIDADSMGLARMLNNRFAGLVFDDPDNKTRIAVGSKNMPVTFTPKGEGGQKGTDKKGFTFSWECDSFAPGWIYEGAIPLSGSNVTGIS